MMEEPLAPQERSESKATSHIVHALVQFAVAVKHRKNVVILCVFIALVIGALYYATATRLYSARAELFIIASGDAAMSTGFAGQGRDGTNMMPTYERLITSREVVERAIEMLEPEERKDLVEVPRKKWAAVIQSGLSAKSIYGTNNIEISYLSRDPVAAVAVVNQVVQAYLGFVDDLHKGTAEDLINGLQQQQSELNQQLEAWQLLLEKKRRACGDFLGTEADSNDKHPIVERLFNIYKEKWETTSQRFDVEAKLRSIRRAVANGGDLQAHVMAVADSVGRELLMSTLGLSARDTTQMAKYESQLLENRAELQVMAEHLGTNHPEYHALANRIREAEQFLASQNDRIRQRTAAMQGRDLGLMLIRVMQQQVESAQHREQLLAEEERVVRAQADGIGSQLIRIKAIERQIEWGHQMRERLLNRLANLSGAEDGPIIRATVVSHPDRPVRPASPNLRRVAMLAFVGGLGVGLAIVYVLDTLDDRFRSVEELQAQVGVPVMAIVQELPRRERCGVPALQLVAEPDAPESEAFRTLRTSLALTHDQSSRLVVTSAEPGDGKTTVMANVAAAYANSGKRTLLIDADLRRPGLTTLLDLRGVDGLSSVLRSEEPVGGVVEQHIHRTELAGLDVLPAGPRPTNPAELLGGQRFADLLAWCEGRYDRILIDSPPALAASDTAIVGQLVDGVLMVVQPLRNERRLVLRAVESFSMLKIPLVGIVANRVGGVGRSGYYGYNVAYGADLDVELDEEIALEDELDCPPEPTKRAVRPHRLDGDGGIDLSQLGEPRPRDAA